MLTLLFLISQAFSFYIIFLIPKVDITHNNKKLKSQCRPRENVTSKLIGTINN